MHNYLIKSTISRVLSFFISIFSTLFWILLAITFEDVSVAIISVVCVIIHECGHLCCLRLFGKKTSIRSIINGFKITSYDLLSYKEERAVYLSGPFFNLLSALFVLPFAKNDYAFNFITLSFLTALSNLLPIEGYDGFGAIRCFIEEKYVSPTPFQILSFLSFCLVFAFCIMSLYLIDRVGEGYWIYAIFLASLIKAIKRDITIQ